MLIQDTERAPRAALLHLLGLSESNFHKLKAAGVFTPSERNSYHLPTALAAWLKYHLDGAAPGDLTEAKRLLAIAQRQRIEQDIRARQRELVETEQVQAAFNHVLVMIAAQLDGLPGRLAGELAGIDDPAEIREVLFTETRRIRDAAAHRLESFATDQAGSEPAETATPEDG